MAKSLAGKTAVITGAGRGIGRSIALTFAEAGADIAICARSSEALDVGKKEGEAKGLRADPAERRGEALNVR